VTEDFPVSYQTDLEIALAASRSSIWSWRIQEDAVEWRPVPWPVGYFEPGLSGGSLQEFLACVHPEDRSAVSAAIKNALKTGVLHCEFRLEALDGSVYWVAGSGQMIRSPQGVALRIVGIMRDVTPQKAAEAEASRLEQQLLRAQRLESIGRLAGGVAHDFNNLLTVISGYAELALRGLGPASPARAQIFEIRRAAERAAELTRHLLAFSRQQVLEPQVFDLNTALAETAKLLERLIGEDIELAIHPCARQAVVHADRAQMEQVIMNLAVNARDAMPNGGKLTLATAVVRLEVEDMVGELSELTPGEYVTLTVRDTGCGIAPEALPLIFEPFFTTKEPGKGSGLGLSTVYGIVKQSGGAITVESQVGVGSAFTVFLPLAQEPPSIEETREAKPFADVRGWETILLVEDQPEVLALGREVLELAGYMVLTAENGAAALSVAENYPGRIHLVVSDMVMPGMSGRDFVERLLNARPETKILFTSGYAATPEAGGEFLRNGFSYLPKPYSPTTLAEKVRAVLGPAENSRLGERARSG